MGRSAGAKMSLLVPPSPSSRYNGNKSPRGDAKLPSSLPRGDTSPDAVRGYGSRFHHFVLMLVCFFKILVARQWAEKEGSPHVSRSMNPSRPMSPRPAAASHSQSEPSVSPRPKSEPPLSPRPKSDVLSSAKQRRFVRFCE